MQTDKEEIWRKKGEGGQPPINCISFSWVTAADLIPIFNCHLGLKPGMITL